MKILLSEERLSKIKEEKPLSGYGITNEFLLIIAEEIISLNKSLNNIAKSLNGYLNSIEYNVRTKK